MAAAEQRRSTSGGLLSQRIAGVPVPVLAVLVGAVGLYLYRKRAAAKTAAAGQQSAANSAQLATTGTSYGDPVLTAYQTGEAAGVASYSAGVTSGISLVDSILGMYPGSTTAGQAGQTAAQNIGGAATNPATTAAAPTPTVGTTGAGSSTGVAMPTSPGQNYVKVSNPAAGGALASGGTEVYLNVPGMPGTYVRGVVNGQPTPAWNQLATQPGVSEYILQ